MTYLAKAERAGARGALPLIHVEDPAVGQSLCGILVHRLAEVGIGKVDRAFCAFPTPELFQSLVRSFTRGSLPDVSEKRPRRTVAR